MSLNSSKLEWIQVNANEFTWMWLTMNKWLLRDKTQLKYIWPNLSKCDWIQVNPTQFKSIWLNSIKCYRIYVYMCICIHVYMYMWMSVNKCKMIAIKLNLSKCDWIEVSTTDF